jgi:hypothetical protein
MAAATAQPAPLENPAPRELWRRFTTVGLDPHQIIYNHPNQPRDGRTVQGSWRNGCQISSTCNYWGERLSSCSNCKLMQNENCNCMALGFLGLCFRVEGMPNSRIGDA